MNSKSGFEILRKYLSRIPHIHWGGCGLSAFYMSQYLDLHEVKHEIVFGYDRDISVSEKDLPVPEHVFLKVGDRYFDCKDSNIDISSWSKTYFVSKEQLEIILHFGTWNNLFKKRIYNDRIEKYFNKLIKNHEISI